MTYFSSFALHSINYSVSTSSLSFSLSLLLKLLDLVISWATNDPDFPSVFSASWLTSFCSVSHTFFFAPPAHLSLHLITFILRLCVSVSLFPCWSRWIHYCDLTKATGARSSLVRDRAGFDLLLTENPLSTVAFPLERSKIIWQNLDTSGKDLLSVRTRQPTGTLAEKIGEAHL